MLGSKHLNIPGAIQGHDLPMAQKAGNSPHPQHLCSPTPQAPSCPPTPHAPLPPQPPFPLLLSCSLQAVAHCGFALQFAPELIADPSVALVALRQETSRPPAWAFQQTDPNPNRFLGAKGNSGPTGAGESGERSNWRLNGGEAPEFFARVIQAYLLNLFFWLVLELTNTLQFV